MRHTLDTFHHAFPDCHPASRHPHAHFIARMSRKRATHSGSKQPIDKTEQRMQTRKIPVTVVTGFLGSGKTTLMRHILQNAKGLRIAVIVNEFGELGIDGEILKGCNIGCEDESVTDQPNLYELSNGCLCCTVQEEFYPVMEQLVERRDQIDHVLIETSGLALPKPLVQAFQLAVHQECVHRGCRRDGGRWTRCGKRPVRGEPAGGGRTTPRRSESRSRIAAA
jgi:hypothetical protein